MSYEGGRSIKEKGKDAAKKEGKRRRRKIEGVGRGICTRWESHDGRTEQDMRWHGRIFTEAGVWRSVMAGKWQ